MATGAAAVAGCASSDDETVPDGSDRDGTPGASETDGTSAEPPQSDGQGVYDATFLEVQR